LVGGLDWTPKWAGRMDANKFNCSPAGEGYPPPPHPLLLGSNSGGASGGIP
jgi:hypothetical protein